jgi:hypothetical protein
VLHSLRRSHVVALFNLLGRLSHSVEVAHVWCWWCPTPSPISVTLTCPSPSPQPYNQVARVVVPLLGAAHATCSPRGCKASEYVVFDAEDEPPGASADGAASGFDSITHPFGV